MADYTFLSAGSFNAILCNSVCHSVDPHWNGFIIRAEYPNGFGVSIVKNGNSIGNRMDLWELAVTKDGRVCLGTPIADDVIGYLDEDGVIEYCEKIRNLA